MAIDVVTVVLITVSSSSSCRPGADGVGNRMGRRRLGGVRRDAGGHRCSGGGSRGHAGARPAVAAASALCLRAGRRAGFYVVMALYSVVAVSSRRAALIVVGLVAAGLAATVIARRRPGWSRPPSAAWL